MERRKERSGKERRKRGRKERRIIENVRKEKTRREGTERKRILKNEIIHIKRCLGFRKFSAEVKICLTQSWK